MRRGVRIEIIKFQSLHIQAQGKAERSVILNNGALCFLLFVQCIVAGAEHFLIEFSDAGLGNGVYEDDIVGKPPSGYERGEIGHYFFFGDLPNVIGFGHDAGKGAF